MGLKATKLAEEMGLSKGRISQLSSNGVFDGCFTGEGRSRRYDLGKCIAAYRGGTDIRQSTGNAKKTHSRISDVEGDLPEGTGAYARPPHGGTNSSRLNEARTAKAEIEARKLARLEKQEEGQWVLAQEVVRETQRLISQEIAIFEATLKDAARYVADQNGLNFKEVRADMMRIFREARENRATELEQRASDADLSEKEIEQDF